MTKNQSEIVICSIEKSFRKQIQKDKSLNSAFLLVHSEKKGIHLNIAEWSMNPKQPSYVASVGKIFMTVLISMFYESGQLSFEDRVTTYLDQDFLKNFHVYKEK